MDFAFEVKVILGLETTFLVCRVGGWVVGCLGGTFVCSKFHVCKVQTTKLFHCCGSPEEQLAIITT